MTTTRRRDARPHVALAVVLFTGMAAAQDAGTPPEASAIPTGRGWWCYLLVESAPDGGSRCLRTRPTCQRISLRDAEPNQGAGECLSRRVAWCFTAVEPGAATPTANCAKTRADCLMSSGNAQREHNTRISDCAETH